MINFEPFKMVTTRNLTKGIWFPGVIALFFLVLILGSCRKEKRPSDILSHVEFTNLMVEVYVSEARLNSTALPRDSAMKLFLPFEKSLLEKHHYSDETLRKTYKYYVEHPKEFEQAFDIIIDSLSLGEQRTSGHPRPRP